MLIALGLSAPAQAHERPRGIGRAGSAIEAGELSLKYATALPLAEAAAVAYWGSEPCGTDVAVVYAPPSASPTDDTGGVPQDGPLWAWTTFNTPDGPMDWAAPPSTYSDCVVTINRVAWSPRRQIELFPTFCALIVHEYGHLFGHPDSASDPSTSITYPDITPENDAVPACTVRYHVAHELWGDYYSAG